MTISSKLLPYIESVCTQGCEAVRSVISDLEQGNHKGDIATLSQDEQAEVLTELKSIMAVYDKQETEKNDKPC